ncbi:Spy/CpxP family protein refolding chaperone [Anabaena azotica]|uniref:Spy/CpxP family protein refolding chaperone n=1 Tax=Anabaena azotica TaxID=197653 RepID=UPI0039A65A4D
MKSKTLSFIAAAFALTLTATPFVAQAQQTSPSGQPGQGYAEKGPWKKLGLTDVQKTEIQKIRRNTRAEMDKVLTDEQKEQLKAAMQERQNQSSQGEGRGKWKKDVFTSLNLTDTQKNQIQTIRESSRKQMEAVLTPAQREQLKQMWENRGSRRQSGRTN